MALQCLHGFPSEQCASCRTCPHGSTTSRCGRCADPISSRAAAKVVPDDQPVAEHRGYEIFFVPRERSWYYRAPDQSASRESFASGFRARRAVDSALDDPAPPPPVRKKRK